MPRPVLPPTHRSRIDTARPDATTPASADAGVSSSSAVTSTSDVYGDGVDVHRPSLDHGPSGNPIANGGRQGATTPLVEGVEFGAHGFRIGRRSSLVDAGISQNAVRTLQEAAKRLAGAQNPFSRLSSDVRQDIEAHLKPFLMYETAYRGRPSSISVRARSAAFSLAMRLVETGTTRTMLPRTRKLIDALMLRAQTEPHSGLRMQMKLALAGLPKMVLTTKQVKAQKEFADAVAPASPPYEQWFGNNEKPELRVCQLVQDEFWRKEIAHYRKSGFKIDMQGDKAIATKTLIDQSGKHKPVEATVELIKDDANVFRQINNPEVNIVLYTGHSNVGSVARWSADAAPNARGNKLIGLFACRTKQNISEVKRRFPDAQLLASDRGTFGHDDRIVIQELLTGIGNRATYAEISQNVENLGPWEVGNYWYPDDGRQLEHLDLDGDGVAAMAGGKPDALFSPPTKKGIGHSISFKPRRTVDPEAVHDGSAIMDAVSWFNSVQAYWSADFGQSNEKSMADRFRSDGWFSSDNTEEKVRVTQTETPDGESQYTVQVNAAYSHLSRDAIGMMVSFELNELLSKQTRPDESAYDRRLRSVAFVSSYAYNLVQFSDEADNLLRSFAKAYDFPPSLSWPVVEKAVRLDHDHEASPKTLGLLEKGMQYPFLEVNPNRSSLEFRTEIKKALDILRKSPTEIGQKTFEAIATGTVLVDEITDLTRADYQRIRKEFLRENVEIGADGHLNLHDKRTKAYRAITSSVDGYMWDNRIYVTRGQSPKNIARTLVHEVNHVLNASEEHYRSKAAIFREEYRAYYAEAMFDGKNLDDPKICRKIKEAVIEDYALEGCLPDDLPDRPPGVLVPT